MIGILRVVAFGHFFWTPNYDFANTWGPSYSAIEPNLAIIAACIPFMRRVLRQWFPRLFASTRRTGDIEGAPYQQHYNTPEARSALTQAMQLRDMVSSHTVIQSRSCYLDDVDEDGAPGILKTTRVRASRPVHEHHIPSMKLTRPRSTYLIIPQN